MNIGIGVTTYNRPEMLSKCLHKIHKFVNPDFANYIIHVAEDTDTDRRGVAYRKNECLKALKECDFVFLFDDDCYPIAPNWVEFFVNSGFRHLLYCKEGIHKKRSSYSNLDLFLDCGGVFMFMDKQTIDSVGAFDENYKMYGFEHADYSARIMDDKIYPVLQGTENYIYAEDYSNPKHKSSISDQEKQLHITKNISIWESNKRNKFIALN